MDVPRSTIRLAMNRKENIFNLLGKPLNFHLKAQGDNFCQKARRLKTYSRAKDMIYVWQYRHLIMNG